MTKQMFHARIWAKLIAHNRTWKLIKPGDRILIGISGGPDSVCMAHYLYKLSKLMKLSVHLLHLHHGLRGGAADRDARSVEQLAALLGIPVTVRRIPVTSFAKKTRRSLEDAGRVLRYRAFVRESKRLSCNKVATAHQADDVAETFILNLMRGTKAEGLAGIPPKRLLSPSPLSSPHRGEGAARGKGIEVIRPIWCLNRKEVLDYLNYHALAFRIDKSNDSMEFTRNWVRRKVLRLLEKRNPEIRGHIARIALDLTLKLKRSG